MILYVVAFEAVLLGSMITIPNEEKHSTLTIPMGGKRTHGK